MHRKLPGNSANAATDYIFFDSGTLRKLDELVDYALGKTTNDRNLQSKNPPDIILNGPFHQCLNIGYYGDKDAYAIDIAYRRGGHSRGKGPVYMKKFVICSILAAMILSVYYGCGAKGEDVTKTVVVHDTIYKDTIVVTKQELAYVDAKWLRRQFEIPLREYWKNYEDAYGVEYPAFMERKATGRDGNRNLRVEYQGVIFTVTTSDEKYDMSVRDKFEAVSPNLGINLV